MFEYHGLCNGFRNLHVNYAKNNEIHLNTSPSGFGGTRGRKSGFRDPGQENLSVDSAQSAFTTKGKTQTQLYISSLAVVAVALCILTIVPSKAAAEAHGEGGEAEGEAEAPVGKEI